MRKMYNERHAYMEELPSDLEVLNELKKRVELNTELTHKLEQLESKDKGINRVLRLLEKYGKEHWMYMTDVAMDYHHMINCDLLIMTSTHVYTLEVNEYEGTFEFKKGASTLDGDILEEHPIQMAQSVLSQLQSSKLMAPIPIHLEIKGAALFTGINNPLKIHNPVEDIEIVPAKSVEKFVRRMVWEEKQARKKGITFNPLYLSWIMRVDRDHPYIPLEIPAHMMEQVRTGILCSHCGSFNVKIGEVLMTCDCGGWESVQEAIIRTTYEYCNLYYTTNLELLSVCKFFNGQVPEKQIEECLEKFLVPIE